MRTLRNILAAGFLATSLLFSSVSALAEKKPIFNQTYSVPMLYEYGEKIEEKINIQAFLDNDANTLYLGTYVQDYNRQDWTGTDKALISEINRHTGINHILSRMFILRPSRAKIAEQEQDVFLIPQYKWFSELQPYEKDERTQLLVETGDRTIDKIISKIPFLGRIYDKYIKNSGGEEADYYNEIFEQIEPDYVYTRIPYYIPKNLVCIETAREYTIKFDIGNTQDVIPIYIWLRIDLGDSSNAVEGSFPNKYGKLENILIKFNLNESNVKRDDLYDYFLHGDELKSINIAKKDVEGTDSNPAVITIKNLDYGERKQYEEDKVVRIGIANYILQEKGGSAEKDLVWGIVQFETQKDREDFMTRKEAELKYPAFVKESILSYIEEPTIEDVTTPLEDFSEEQYIIYGDLILDYMSRTGMDVILNKNPVRSERLLKEIENYKKERE